MKKVLLIDDNEDMVELVKLVLADSGYELIVAADGKDAVTTCLEIQPDLVLMDLNLSGMDGFSAMQKLRSGGYDKPIVVLTGSDNQEYRDKAKAAGCNDYILKTMDMAEVKSTLDRYLAEAGDGLKS